MKKYKMILMLVGLLFVTGCTNTKPSEVPQNTNTPTSQPTIAEDTTCDDVACVSLYLHTYNTLPSNYMTKKEARTYGWENGPLYLVVEGMSIGGDPFGNYEGVLPEEDTYYECDIDTLGAKSRGSKRIVYSDDGDIYYTSDHYETFEQLYGE